jgi:hypothetical protein
MIVEGYSMYRKPDGEGLLVMMKSSDEINKRE